METMPQPIIEDDSDLAEQPVDEPKNEPETAPLKEVGKIDESISQAIRVEFGKVINELKGNGVIGAPKPPPAAEPIWLAAEIKTVGELTEIFCQLDHFPTDAEARAVIEENTPNFGNEEYNFKWRRAVKYAALYALGQARLELQL